MNRMLLPIAALLALAACSASQQTAATNAVATGQLYCAKATTAGPLVVALADAAGAPVTVTGKAAATVASACAVIDAIPVEPPPDPAAAPVVAAPVVALRETLDGAPLG